MLNKIAPFVTASEHPVVTTLAGSIRDVLGVQPELFGFERLPLAVVNEDASSANHEVDLILRVGRRH